MGLALMAIRHWDKLAADEQGRFRTLAARATSLEPDERKELRVLWKRLEVKRLLAEAVRFLVDDQTVR
jgi:hypothetical protein